MSRILMTVFQAYAYPTRFVFEAHKPGERDCPLFTPQINWHVPSTLSSIPGSHDQHSLVRQQELSPLPPDVQGFQE